MNELQDQLLPSRPIKVFHKLRTLFNAWSPQTNVQSSTRSPLSKFQTNHLTTSRIAEICRTQSFLTKPDDSGSSASAEKGFDSTCSEYILNSPKLGPPQRFRVVRSNSEIASTTRRRKLETRNILEEETLTRQSSLTAAVSEPTQFSALYVNSCQNLHLVTTSEKKQAVATDVFKTKMSTSQSSNSDIIEVQTEPYVQQKNRTHGTVLACTDPLSTFATAKQSPSHGEQFEPKLCSRMIQTIQLPSKATLGAITRKTHALSGVELTRKKSTAHSLVERDACHQNTIIRKGNTLEKQSKKKNKIRDKSSHARRMRGHCNVNGFGEVRGNDTALQKQIESSQSLSSHGFFKVTRDVLPGVQNVVCTEVAPHLQDPVGTRQYPQVTPSALCNTCTICPISDPCHNCPFGSFRPPPCDQKQYSNTASKLNSTFREHRYVHLASPHRQTTSPVTSLYDLRSLVRRSRAPPPVLKTRMSAPQPHFPWAYPDAGSNNSVPAVSSTSVTVIPVTLPLSAKHGPLGVPATPPLSSSHPPERSLLFLPSLDSLPSSDVQHPLAAPFIRPPHPILPHPSAMPAPLDHHTPVVAPPADSQPLHVIGNRPAEDYDSGPLNLSSQRANASRHQRSRRLSAVIIESASTPFDDADVADDNDLLYEPDVPADEPLISPENTATDPSFLADEAADSHVSVRWTSPPAQSNFDTSAVTSVTTVSSHSDDRWAPDPLGAVGEYLPITSTTTDPSVATSASPTTCGGDNVHSPRIPVSETSEIFNDDKDVVAAPDPTHSTKASKPQTPTTSQHQFPTSSNELHSKPNSIPNEQCSGNAAINDGKLQPENTLDNRRPGGKDKNHMFTSPSPPSLSTTPERRVRPLAKNGNLEASSPNRTRSPNHAVSARPPQGCASDTPSSIPVRQIRSNRIARVSHDDVSYQPPCTMPRSKRLSVSVSPASSTCTMTPSRRPVVNRRGTVGSSVRSSLSARNSVPVSESPSNSRSVHIAARSNISARKSSSPTDRACSPSVALAGRASSKLQRARQLRNNTPSPSFSHEIRRGSLVTGSTGSGRTIPRRSPRVLAASSRNTSVPSRRGSIGVPVSRVRGPRKPESSNENRRKSTGTSLLGRATVSRVGNAAPSRAAVVAISGTLSGRSNLARKTVTVERRGMTQQMMKTPSPNAKGYLTNSKPFSHGITDTEATKTHLPGTPYSNVSRRLAGRALSMVVTPAAAESDLVGEATTGPDSPDEKERKDRAVSFAVRCDNMTPVRRITLSPDAKDGMAGRQSMDSNTRKVVFFEEDPYHSCISSADVAGHKNDGDVLERVTHTPMRVSAAQGRPERSPMRRMLSFHADRSTMSPNDSDSDKAHADGCDESVTSGELSHGTWQTPSNGCFSPGSSSVIGSGAWEKKLITVTPTSGRERAKVTVPRPFQLSGETLQERTKAAIEDARRKKAEVESRRRVFRARPMPDFSRPFPKPKGAF